MPNLQFSALTITSIALDPQDTKRMVVAFPARDTSAGADPDNIDIYLAVGLDGAQSFPSTNVYHISDVQLRLPGETGRSIELMPAVWIDHFGGVCLMVVRTDSAVGTPNGDASMSVRLARWSSASVLTGTPWLVDMAPPFKMPVGFVAGTGGNDYHMLTGSGCYVWGSYTKLDPNLRAAVYVRRLDFCSGDAIADFNLDTAVNPADLIAFALAYTVGAPGSDVNHDGAVSPSDVITFQNAYNALVPP